MTVTCVSVRVKPEHIEDFILATAENHRHSVQEPGNLRFDVLQREDAPGEFLLYEAYETLEAAAAHKDTRHYLEWRVAVEPWMAQPREGVRHRVVEPTDRSGW